MAVNAGPRMIAFAYLAMSAEMAILEAADRGHKKLVWLLPPLFCLWINLHGTWLSVFVCSRSTLRADVSVSSWACLSRRRLLLTTATVLAVLGASCGRCW